MIFAEKLRSTLKLLSFIFIIPPFFSACSTTNTVSSNQPSSTELHLINNPPKETVTKINALIPDALKWYDNVAQSLYAKGRVLTESEKQQAKQLGIKNPDAIRVVILDKFPEPNNQTANNHSEGARAMGNIIMIKPRHQNNSLILCHELVHIAQKDRLGLTEFLKRYALEREVLGYSRSMLENEAYALQQVIR